MPFEDPSYQVDQATYALSAKYEPEGGTGYGITFNLNSNIGDGTPTEAQEVAFQALIDLFETAPDFEVLNAFRTYSGQQTITPSE